MASIDEKSIGIIQGKNNIGNNTSLALTFIDSEAKSVPTTLNPTLASKQHVINSKDNIEKLNNIAKMGNITISDMVINIKLPTILPRYIMSLLIGAIIKASSVSFSLSSIKDLLIPVILAKDIEDHSIPLAVLSDNDEPVSKANEKIKIIIVANPLIDKIISLFLNSISKSFFAILYIESSGFFIFIFILRFFHRSLLFVGDFF